MPGQRATSRLARAGLTGLTGAEKSEMAAIVEDGKLSASAAALATRQAAAHIAEAEAAVRRKHTAEPAASAAAMGGASKLNFIGGGAATLSEVCNHPLAARDRPCRRLCACAKPGRRMRSLC